MIREVNIYVQRAHRWPWSDDQQDEEDRQVGAVLENVPKNVPVHVYDNDGVYLYTPQGEEGQHTPSSDLPPED